MSAGDLGSRRAGRAGLGCCETVEPHDAQPESEMRLSIGEERASRDHDRLMALRRWFECQIVTGDSVDGG